MKKILTALIATVMPLCASIQKSDSVVASLESLDVNKRDLVVLDIDLTLIAPSEPAFHYPQIKKFRKQFKNACPMSPLQQVIALDLIPLNYPSQVIEEKLPDLLNNLKNQGTTVVALTASSPHPLGKDRVGAKARYDQLTAFGFRFSTPLDDYTPFEECEKALDYYPTFVGGVIAAGTMMRHDGGTRPLNPKGTVIVNLIKQLPFKPNRVIFVDDRLDHLEYAEQACQEAGVEYVGIEFRGADHLTTEAVSEERFFTVWKELASQAQSVIDRYLTAE